MPSVDLSGVTDYASFEAVYDSLLEVVLAAITDDHRTFTESTGEYSATFEHVRLIGEQPERRDGYNAVSFNDRGTVSLTWPERGKADGWGSDYDVNNAMAVCLHSVISRAA